MPGFRINFSFRGKVRRVVIALLSLMAAVHFAGRSDAGPRDDMLYWSTASEFENISPYFDFRPELDIFSHLIWDRLFYRDPNAPTFKPHLATELKWVGITTIELALRKDVVFHNGDRFSADDVLETVRRLKNPKFGAPKHRAVAWIAKIEKLSDYRVRIDLKRPMPHVLELLAGPLIIVPRSVWRSAPIDANGKPDYIRMAPVGSGPYRVTRIDPRTGVELERYRRYHDGPKGRPAIGRIMFTSVSDPRERLEQLLDGRIDWLGNLAKEAVDRLETIGAPVQLARTPSMRIAFLMMDGAGRNGKLSPFKDPRVRHAVAHSINRAEIARNIFGSTSKVMHSFCFPKQIGCAQDVPRYTYDPEKSKKLLRSAGYGPASGNRVADVLNTLGERLPGESIDKKKRLKSIVGDIVSYRNHPASEAMSLYLQAIGIDSRVEEYSNFETAERRLKSGGLDLAHMTWASHGSLDVADILNPLFRNGQLDYCRDNEINRWLDVAANTKVGKARNRAFQNALKRLQDLACIIPLFNYTTFYAYSRRLSFTPTLDDVPRFYRAKWK